MRIVFDEMENIAVEKFKGGEGVMESRMFFDGKARILYARLKPHSTIGLHAHETNCEIMFFISGRGKALCDGVEEPVGPGICHYCPQGSNHVLINEGEDDLVFYAAVV